MLFSVVVVVVVVVVVAVAVVVVVVVVVEKAYCLAFYKNLSSRLLSGMK